MARRRRNPTQPPAEATVGLEGNSNHEIMSFGAAKSCDLCGLKVNSVFVWPEADTKITAEDRATLGLRPLGGQYWLCDECDVELWAQVNSEETEEETQIVNTPNRFPLLGNPKLPAAPAKPATTYVSLCNASFHWEKITGGAKAGFLRIASLRGGWEIDPETDYALFFDSGWKDVMKVEATRYNPSGKSDDIPHFPGETTLDRSKWPAIAFIPWPDMKAPTEEGIEAARWAAKQWDEGKNIQFGCHGAHGRTGTFLSMLLLLTGRAATAYDAVESARTLVCKKGVETGSQADFLEQFAVERLGLAPSAKKPTGSGGSWTSSTPASAYPGAYWEM